MNKKAPNDAGQATTTPQKEKAAADVVLIHGVTDDKKGLRVLRARHDRLESGEVRPLAEGKPITHDVVRLKPRPGMPLVCDVETELLVGETGGQQPARTTHSGPAQVASRAYRDNWDMIWARSEATTSDPSKLN